MKFIGEQTFTDVSTTQTTDAFNVTKFESVLVTLEHTKSGGDKTLTPEVQFNPLPAGDGSWSTSGELNVWNGTTGMSVLNTTGTSLSTSNGQAYLVPVFGPLVRVLLTIGGTTGDWDSIRVLVWGRSGGISGIR